MSSKKMILDKKAQEEIDNKLLDDPLYGKAQMTQEEIDNKLLEGPSDDFSPCTFLDPKIFTSERPASKSKANDADVTLEDCLADITLDEYTYETDTPSVKESDSKIMYNAEVIDLTKCGDEIDNKPSTSEYKPFLSSAAKRARLEMDDDQTPPNKENCNGNKPFNDKFSSKDLKAGGHNGHRARSAKLHRGGIFKRRPESQVSIKLTGSIEAISKADFSRIKATPMIGGASAMDAFDKFKIVHLKAVNDATYYKNDSRQKGTINRGLNAIIEREASKPKWSDAMTGACSFVGKIKKDLNSELERALKERIIDGDTKEMLSRALEDNK